MRLSRVFGLRSWLGLASAVAIAAIIRSLATPRSDGVMVGEDEWVGAFAAYQAQQAFYTGIAFFVGGFVARRGLLPLAIAFNVLGWVGAYYVMYEIASFAPSFAAFKKVYPLVLLFSLAASILGVGFGERLAQKYGHGY